MQRVPHLIRAHVLAAAVAFTEPQPLFPLPLTSSLEHLDPTSSCTGRVRRDALLLGVPDSTRCLPRTTRFSTMLTVWPSGRRAPKAELRARHGVAHTTA